MIVTRKLYDVVRRDVLTHAPGWPEHVYVSCLHMLDEERAVIGLYDGGVLVADLRSQTFKRIVLGWSYDPAIGHQESRLP